jgi:hypothetical protein
MLIVLFAYSSVFGFYIDYLFLCANIKKSLYFTNTDPVFLSFPTRLNGFPTRLNGFPTRLNGFQTRLNGYPTRLKGFFRQNGQSAAEDWMMPPGGNRWDLVRNAGGNGR